MSAKLQSPAVVAALAICMSVAVGVMSFWRAAAPLLEKAALVAAANVKVPPAELKEKGWDFWTIEIENLSTELKGERDRLRKQQEQLDQRAALLATEAKELAKVRSEIEQVRKTISEKIVEVSADDAKNIATLAKTYTNLTPKAVVAIVRDLDDNTVVKILSQMKVDVVSPIFEEMSRSAGNDGGPLSKRVAILSEKMRQVKAAAKPAPTP